jgi:hypothetical protein
LPDPVGGADEVEGIAVVHAKGWQAAYRGIVRDATLRIVMVENLCRSARSLDRHCARFDKLNVRVLCATKIAPQPELVEGRTAIVAGPPSDCPAGYSVRRSRS